MEGSTNAVRAAEVHAPLCRLVADVAKEVVPAGFDVKEKGESGLDFVTSVDLAIQERLQRDLGALLPDAPVLGEEGFVETGSVGLVWLVDPLDGTVNFVAGLPSYAISVVLLDGGLPILAAVHDIPHDATYSAIRGGGAFLDGAPLIRRSSGARLGIVSSGLLRDLAAEASDALVTLLGRVKLRNFGSQALHLCYAASGHVSLVASREAKGWDDMAGALIAQEAGLRYGSYHPAREAPAPIAADQHSLCAPGEVFDDVAPLLARSVRG